MPFYGTHELLRWALLMATLVKPSGQPLPLQKGEVVLAGPSSIVSWQMKRLAPPSPLYVTVDDILRVTAATSQSNELVTVNYRLLRAFDGAVVFGQFTVAPPSNRAVKTVDQPLTEGFLLSASCQAAVATTRGQTFARLLLNPKALGAGQPAQMLMADYVTTAMAPGFPNGRVLAPEEGPGWIQNVTLTSPAAGHDFSIAVPTNARWRLQGADATYASSAVAANRTVALQAFGSVNRQFATWSAYTQVASQTVEYIFANGVANMASPLFSQITVAIPLGVLLSGSNGDQLKSLTSGLSAGDQWSAISFTVEEWLQNV